MSDLDRDKFYSAGSEDDESDDYELEPPDAEVLAHEQRRAQESIDAARRAIDIDQIYRDTCERSGEEIFGEWFKNRRFQFQTKHLLIATAVLAVLLVLWKFSLLGDFVLIAAMGCVFGIYAFVEWREKQFRDEAERRRQEMYERARVSRNK